MEWKLALAGLLIGSLVGLTGMGGGSLMTPLLIFLFGFNPSVAIGTDILHGAVFKTVGAARHRRLGTVHARLSLWMFLASAPMSLVGVTLATWLKHRYGDSTDSLLGVILGAALLWVAGMGHFIAGNVDLSSAGWLLIGSVPGVLFSSQFTVRLPDRSLRIALSTVLIASGTKLVDVPAANAIVIAVLAAGAGLVAFSVSRGFGRAAAAEGTRQKGAP